MVQEIYFTDDPKDYEVGDTITIGLSDGTKAIYELVRIDGLREKVV